MVTATYHDTNEDVCDNRQNKNTLNNGRMAVHCHLVQHGHISDRIYKLKPAELIHLSLTLCQNLIANTEVSVLRY